MFEIQKYSRGAELLYDTDDIRVIGCRMSDGGWKLLESDFDGFINELLDAIRHDYGFGVLVETIKYDNYKDAYLDMFIESITA